jgi:hypothetical protein
VLQHEITDRKEFLVGHWWAPRLYVVAARKQAAYVIVKRPLAAPARKVVPNSNSHN